MTAAADRRAAEAEGEGAGPSLPDPYEIVSVRPVPAPGGTSGANWHRYEIKQGANTIVGYRAGGTEHVMFAIESIVLRLNERRKDRRGRVHVVLRPRSRVP